MFSNITDLAFNSEAYCLKSRDVYLNMSQGNVLHVKKRHPCISNKQGIAGLLLADRSSGAV